MNFLLGGIYVLEMFLDSSSILLNFYFWGILKERPSDKIRSAMERVRRVSLEVIIF